MAHGRRTEPKRPALVRAFEVNGFCTRLFLEPVYGAPVKSIVAVLLSIQPTTMNDCFPELHGIRVGIMVDVRCYVKCLCKC